MAEQKQNHPVTVILRNWTKAKKANSRPVAEIHTKETRQK